MLIAIDQAKVPRQGQQSSARQLVGHVLCEYRAEFLAG
jgi:hypothetical protein